MLQQTRVETVIPYYRKFIERFPDVASLSGAPLEDVLKAWENLGYYARARHLHAAAAIVVNDFGGKVPDTLEHFRALPGIGPYTAGAVLSIAYGRRLPAVDGNVRRVLSRLFALGGPRDRRRMQKRMQRKAAGLVPPHDPGGFNQALMDLGALVCLPRVPACAACPVQARCRAFQKGLQHDLPLKPEARRVPHKTLTAGIVRDARGRLLIVRRPPKGLLGGLWKFPGGERQGGEALEEALAAALEAELGLEVRVAERVATVKHAYTHFRMTLHAFRCEKISRRPRPRGCADWAWVRPSGFGTYAFSRADRKVIEAL
jgi:A/G-specific adenine glycosylase